MAISKTDPWVTSIQEYIKAGISKEATKIATEHKEQIIKDVEDAMSDIVAKMSVRLAKHYRVEDLGQEIRIVILKEAISARTKSS